MHQYEITVESVTAGNTRDLRALKLAPYWRDPVMRDMGFGRSALEVRATVFVTAANPNDAMTKAMNEACRIPMDQAGEVAPFCSVHSVDGVRKLASNHAASVH